MHGSTVRKYYLLKLFTDQLVIGVTPTHLTINQGGTAQFNAIAGGIGTFSYQWKKRDINKLPNKVLVVSDENRTTLIIPKLNQSDEGLYYCVVTNMWNRRVESNNVTLNIYGMLVAIITIYL